MIDVAFTPMISFLASVLANLVGASIVVVTSRLGQGPGLSEEQKQRARHAGSLLLACGILLGALAPWWGWLCSHSPFLGLVVLVPALRWCYGERLRAPYRLAVLYSVLTLLGALLISLAVTAFMIGKYTSMGAALGESAPLVRAVVSAGIFGLVIGLGAADNDEYLSSGVWMELAAAALWTGVASLCVLDLWSVNPASGRWATLPPWTVGFYSLVLAAAAVRRLWKFRQEL